MRLRYIIGLTILSFSPIIAVANPFSDMVFNEKINYMQSKLDKWGYFTPYEYLYRRYQKPTKKWNDTFIDEYEKAVSCASALQTREDKISKICFQTQETSSARRQNHFKLEWFEDNKLCQSIKAYYLSDETMIIGTRNINFATWIEENEKVVVSAPNSRGKYHRFDYNKNTNTGLFTYNEQVPIRYENCMDYKDYTNKR